MTDELHQFLNRIRILHCVDGYEIEAAMQSTGLEMTAQRYCRFRSNPVEFMIQADDPTQRALWSIIELRESRRRDAETAVSAISAAPAEMVENAAIALFTKHWQRKPDTRDFATGALDSYRVIAADVLASVAYEAAGRGLEGVK